MQLRSILVLAVAVLAACSNDGTSTARALLEVEPERVVFSSGRGTLTVRNVGSAPLAIEALETRSNDAATFTVTSAPARELSPGADLTIALEADGRGSGVLTIRSNADNAPVRDVPLDATGATGTPDGGSPGDGGSDAGPEPEPPCTWTLGADVEVGSTSSGVSDLAIASNEGGFTVAWWTDDLELGVRSVTANGTPTGAARNVFSYASARSAWSLVGAADASGPVFVAMSESGLGKRLHRVDLRSGAPASEELDAASDYSGLAMAPSAGGLATLFRSAHDGVVLRRDGGTAAFAARDTMLPTSNTFAHSLAPVGDAFAVAWHGVVGSDSPISGAKVDASGAVILGSSQRLSIGGAKNLRPVLAATSAGLAAGWIQDSGAKRTAVGARFDADLRTQTGDIPLADMGPVGSASGSLAAVALGTRLAVAWTRFDANGAVLGFDLGGLTADGRVLGLASLNRTSLSRFADLALATIGDDVLVAFADVDGATTRIRAAHAACR